MGLSSGAAPVAAVATGLPDTYKDKQLKELVNDWQNQLKIDVAAFDKQATQVAGWWRELAQKESDIHVMVEELTVLDLKQKDVDRKLDEAEGFQTEVRDGTGRYGETVTTVVTEQTNPVVCWCRKVVAPGILDPHSGSKYSCPWVLFGRPLTACTFRHSPVSASTSTLKYFTSPTPRPNVIQL